MALPVAIRTAFDTLWDEIQASPDKEFSITRCVVGQRTYKVRLFRLTANNNNQHAYRIEIIRKT